MTLPGNLPTELAEALDRQAPERRKAFLNHFHAGTSAAYLSDWLTRAGTPVPATSIESYRRSLE